MEQDKIFLVCIFLLEALAAATFLPRILKSRASWKQLLRSHCRDLCEQCGLTTKASTDMELRQKQLNQFHASQCQTFHRLMCLILGLVLARGLVVQMSAVVSASLQQYQHAGDDFPSIALGLLGLLVVNCRQASSPSFLNGWYALLTTMQLVFVEDHDARGTLARLLFGVIAKNYSWVVAGTAASAVVMIYRDVSDSPEAMTDGMIGTAFSESILALTACSVVRWQLWANARIGVSLKSSVVELSAVYRILTGLCDAVVVLDDSLQLEEDSGAFSTLLLHGYSAGRADLTGKDFVAYFRPQDRDHVREGLTSSRVSAGDPALALNASLQDSLGNCINVELLHLQFERTEGCRRYMVGIREYQHDVAAVSPLVEGEADASGTADVSTDDGGAVGSFDSDLLFDAGSLEVLYVSEELRQRCLGSGHDEPDCGTLHDFPSMEGHESLVAQVQLAINKVGRQPSPPIHFQNLRLLGLQVDSLRLEHDTLLDTLVGSLHIAVEAEPAAQARGPLSTRGRLSPRRRSGGSRASSRSNRSRHDESGQGSRAGDIRSLHCHVAL